MSRADSPAVSSIAVLVGRAPRPTARAAAPAGTLLAAAAVTAAGTLLAGAAAASGPAVSYGGPGRQPRPPSRTAASIRDLGTLGGSWSRALGVSPDGRTVVGASQVAPGRLHAVSAHAFLWRDGRMTDLGTLGGTESEARDVNDAGQVVGVAEADSGRGVRMAPPRVPAPGRRLVDVRERAFLWEDGRMRDLGTLGGRASEAHGVNGRGWVVGRSQVEPGRLHSTSHHAFLWRDGRMEDLGTLGGTESVAFDVDDAGRVVGASRTARDRSGRVEVHAFLWEEGRMRDLGTLGGRVSRARAVSGRGRVAGTSTDDEGLARAFLWEEGRMRDLGTLGGRTSRAWDLDDRGRVVGASTTADGEVHGFLWEDGRMEDLGTLDGDARAYAVADGGPVVGASRTRRTREGQVSVHAVLWDQEDGTR